MTEVNSGEPTQLARVMLNLRWDLEQFLEKGNFGLMYKAPVETKLDSVAIELFSRVREGKSGGG